MSWLDDDGMPSGEFAAVERVNSGGHRQAIWVRVGPVYHGNEEAREPGIWVNYQQEWMNSRPEGDVLLTPETWKQLNRAVRRRLRYRRRRRWFRKLGL